MITFIRNHLIWSTVVLLSAIAIFLILVWSFKVGVLVLAVSALVLTLARAAGATDKLLQIRTKSVDIAIYGLFSLALALLAVVIPTG